MEKYAKRFTKQEKSWILYDWANSVYATNIMAAIFPIYFGAVCESAGVDTPLRRGEPCVTLEYEGFGGQVSLELPLPEGGIP